MYLYIKIDLVFSIWKWIIIKDRTKNISLKIYNFILDFLNKTEKLLKRKNSITFTGLREKQDEAVDKPKESAWIIK